MAKKRPTSSPRDPNPSVRRQPGCVGCPALCCKDLAINILKPRTRQEIEELKWQLQFDTVRVFIANKRWHMLVQGRCVYLSPNNLCTIYEDRPDKCRRHNPPHCERYGEFYDVMLETPDDLEAHLAREKRRRAARRARKNRPDA